MTYNIAIVLIFLGLIIPFLVIIVNPVLIFIISFFFKEKNTKKNNYPSISIIIAVHNGEFFIKKKIENSLKLEYNKILIETIVVSDGSNDETEKIVESYRGKGIKIIILKDHEGKIAALNKAIQQCRGELVLFSDVDAILEKKTLISLVSHFSDARVGGVCGQRVISGLHEEQMKNAQDNYVRLDSLIKQWESRLGSITSNDGKIYMIRKELFVPIPPAVTDDLFVCLGVTRQGFRFHFEPAARAVVPVPSTSVAHEIERRRRIVSQSLNSLNHYRELLDIRRFGFFSFRLLVNKVLRRMMPFSIIFLLIGTILIAKKNSLAFLAAILQCIFFFFALIYPLLEKSKNNLIKPVKKICSTFCYFFVGNYGTFLGVVDFFMDKQPKKWVPRKNIR